MMARGRYQAPVIDDAASEVRLKRRGVWKEIRNEDDYALLALA
jgi:hypothetical protein